MVKELQVQTHIKKSVIRDGGFAFKQTNTYTIGILDLKICLFPFVPCDIEVKDLGEVVRNFDRDAGVTPKQADTIRRMNKVYEDGQTIYTPLRRVAGVIVRVVHNGHDVLIPAAQDKETGTWRVRSTYGAAAPRQVGGYYDIRPLLQEMGICRIQAM
jgi:hypothetical protein